MASGRRPSIQKRAYIADLEGGYTDDEWEFIRAMDRYKRANKRPHPTCAEVLAVAKGLGYRKVLT